MQLIKKVPVSIFLFLLLLLFVRTDYRLLNELACCGDDFDYYSHAYSIAVDFDFDYSNQLIAGHSETFFYNGKIAPLGFVGSGILASPFMFMGNMLDLVSVNESINNKILIYSLSSIFYFFISIKLIFITLINLNKKPNLLFLILAFLGSGLSYYAFERYSMTHVYEVFTISLIFYLTINVQQDKSKRDFYIFLIPLVICLGILVRYTNYYIILLPFIFKNLFFKNDKSLFTKKDIKFLGFSSVIALYVYYFFTKNIYGIFTINPSTLYMDNSILTNFLSELNNPIQFIILNIKSTFIILFSQEFGIFWFSPIIFFGIVSIIFNYRNAGFLLTFCIFCSFIQNIVVVIMWQSTASSYGFRYLLSLVPLSVIIFYSLENNYFKKLSMKYISIFSCFGLLSVLFFESTFATELSTVEVLNSFGNNTLYTNPNYLFGFVTSLINFEAYLNIFGNSFLFAIILKFLLVFGLESTIINAIPFDLPDRFELFLDILDGISMFNFFIISLFLFFFLRYFFNIKKSKLSFNFSDQL
tara:strand:+ start:8283 stop:9866 length:1584 start_codon:yes stop_codon:yes gene_type:complete